MRTMTTTITAAIVKTRRKCSPLFILHFSLFILLAACTQDDATTPDGTLNLTIGCNIGAPALTPDTRAAIDTTNTDKTKELFIWHEGDTFGGYLMADGKNTYEPQTPIFRIDNNYSSKKPSNSASFTSTNFPSGSYKMLAVSPSEMFYQPSAEGVFTLSFPDNVVQRGNNSSHHLHKRLAMYAIAQVAKGSQAPTMMFKHLTSILRFTVTNKNGSPRQIIEIRVSTEGGEKVFGTEHSFGITDWTTATINCTDATDTRALKLMGQNGASGLTLAGADATDKSNQLDGYALAIPGTDELTDTKLIFKLTTKDANGVNDIHYITLALDANKIIAANKDASTWEAGKRYWFNLVLDNELTVALKEVSNLPGWDEETDL